jgi:21S rRNA (uridine2791-2'-O)-methyltransferase
MTKPFGRVLGVDIIPAQPPKGVSTIQGNFLFPDVQASILSFLRDPDRGRALRPQVYTDVESERGREVAVDADMTRGYLDRERHDLLPEVSREGSGDVEKTVDVVLSDMCEPWEQMTGFYNRTLSDPYLRMMNTSGNNFRDHVGSMVSLSTLFIVLAYHREFS